MRYRFAHIGVLALILLAAGVYRAQAGTPNVIKLAATAPKTAATGKPFTLVIAITIDKQYHIQANPAKENYIPTVVQIGAVPGVKVGKIVYPHPIQATMFGETLPVYEGTVEVKAQVTASKAGKFKLPISVRYQACNDRTCNPPTSATTEAIVTVGAAQATASHSK